MYLQRFEHKSTRLLSPRITIVRFHQKFNTFNVDSLLADSCETSYLLVHTHRVELKVRVGERARVIVDIIWVLFKVLPYHSNPTTTTDATYLHKCLDIPKSHRQRPPSLHLNTARFSGNRYVEVRTHRTSG